MNSQFGIVRPVFTNNVNKFISIVLRADNCVNNWHLFCDRQTKMSSSLDDEIEPWKCENISIEFFFSVFVSILSSAMNDRKKHTIVIAK